MADALPDVDLDLFRLSFVLTRAANRFSRHVESTVHRPRGLTTAGFRILFTLWSSGPLPAHRIALLAGLSRASVSSVVNTLERDGRVERTRGDDDRRVVTVSLTPPGEAAVRETYEGQYALEQTQYEGLSPTERAALAEALATLDRHPVGWGRWGADLEAHPAAVRVVERSERGGCRNSGAVHVDLEGALDDLGAGGVGLTSHVAHAQGAAHRVAVHARGDADQDAVAVHGLVVVEQRVWIVEAELHQPSIHPGLALGHQGIVADEATGLVEGHAPREAGVERRVLLGDVVAPVAVGLLHAQ